MSKWLRMSACAAIIVGVVFVGDTADAQVDQRSLAEQLLGQDIQQRTKALNAVQRMKAADVNDDLRLALIALLERANDTVRNAVRTGQPLDEDPSFIAAVSRVVAGLRDLRAVAVLSEAVYGGITAGRALAEFGEPAAPALLRLVTSTDSHYTTVDHALVALRLMAEQAQYRSLSSATREQIRAAAAQRLEQPEYFTTLWMAIDLAVVLGDPSLRQVVEVLASNPGAVASRGIGDPTVIERTQKRAAERLAGVPPAPRF